METIKENWYSFNRYYCKEGFIDSWSGDSANSPNEQEKKNYQLNSTVTMYRLNGKGQWYSRNFLKSIFNSIMSIECQLFSANEIWHDALINAIRYMTGLSKSAALKILKDIDATANEEMVIEQIIEESKKIL
jgi:hypothetical protein